MEYADGWVPNEDDVIVGTITGLDLGWSPYPAPSGSNYPIITVRAEKGSTETDTVTIGEEVAIHCFHSALRSKLQTLKPVLGETIGMQYKGKRPSKQHPTQEVAVYVVKVKGRTADVWGALAAATPPPPSPAVATHGGFTPHPVSDVPANTSDFTTVTEDADDDIPF